jgi:autophagy-related protein 13
VFRDDLRLWKTADAYSKLPPLVVETYLDLTNLSPHQALVAVDSNGKMHNVTRGQQKAEVVLERWVIEVDGSAEGSDLNQDLPVVYKKAIILFRSLFAYCRILPCWELKARLARSKLNLSSLSIGCRVLNGSQPISSKGRIGLSKAIIADSNGKPSSSHLESFSFADIPSPAGYMKVSVSYRTNVNFKVSDSEALLSSQFLSSEEANTSTSPTSARRMSLSPNSSSFSLARSKASVKSNDDHTTTASGKHPSIQPFKSPSLSASPNDQAVPPPPRQPSNSSLAALRIPQRTMSSTSQSSGRSVIAGTNQGSVPDNAICSSASSGSSAPKYSSSFSSRTGGVSRFRPQSFSGEPSSAGSNSSSIMEPGSGFYVDDVELGNFVKMVDSAKLLKPGGGRNNSSLSGSSSGGSGSEKLDNRGNPLARFQLLRGNHAALSDSLQSSTYVPQESGSGNTIGTSPHNKGSNHTPLVPSRLSEEFTPAGDADRNMPQVRRESKQSTGSGGSVGEVSNSMTSPWDIPRERLYRLQGAKESSSSVGNTRTAGYDDMHAQVDFEARHQSLSPRDIFSTAVYNSSLNKQQSKPETNQSPYRRNSSSTRRFSYFLPTEEDDDDTATPATATTNQPQGEEQRHEQDDDDDLLFAMSDMHLHMSKNPYEPLQWEE